QHGPEAVRAFRSAGAVVFLDLKLHDIPNTVEAAAAGGGALGGGWLDVPAPRGGGGRVGGARGTSRGGGCGAGLATRRHAEQARARVGGRGGGVGGWGGWMAERCAGVAVGAGIGGLVCSAREAPPLLARHPGVFLCTPGIRPAGAAVGDQARVETPAAAIAA